MYPKSQQPLCSMSRTCSNPSGSWRASPAQQSPITRLRLNLGAAGGVALMTHVPRAEILSLVPIGTTGAKVAAAL